MNTENKANPAPAPVEQDKTARIGLWVSLGVAAAAAVGVLAVAFYMDYQERKTLVAEPVEPVLTVSSSHSTPSSIPTSETQAASIAAATSDEQSKGMTAPSDVETHEAPVVQHATPEVAASSPAQTILAQENVINATSQVVVENGVVKFTFAKDKADVAANTLEALKDVVEGVKTGKKAVIISHTDAQTPANLTKERALAVRSVLLAAGVPSGSIEVKEPTTSDNTRVEVALQ